MAISYGTYTITEVQEGSQIWTTTVAPVSPNYTFTISNLTGDSETSIKVGDIIMYSYYRYTVLSISDDGTTVLTGNRVSIRGATGAASVTYTLIVSNLAIIKDKNGNISPTTITLTAKSQTGSGAMANYAGRFKIETTTNNSTWTTQYTSSANEATKNWAVIDDIIAIRCSLYLKDGTTTLLDQQTIPIVSDGIDGTNITITSTSVTYQEGESGTVKPTGTWGTGVPTVAQGHFLWTKTIVNYSDGSSTESYSVSRNAVNGTNGTSPTVTSTVTEYAQSNNGTTTPTSGWDTTPPSTVTAGYFMWTRITVTYSDNATSVSYTVSKNGTNGSNGINTATVYLYKRGTTAPSVPSGNTTYTFSTKKLTGTLDSWSQAIPTTGNGECYVTVAVASSNGTTDTIGTGEWSTPIQFNGTNGTNGTNGLNQATIFLYKRGASVTKPTTSVTYTFSSGALSAEPDSWKRNIPTIDGNPCWVVTATAIGNGTSATIAGSNWSDPIKLVEDGVDGKDAYTVILTNENHTFTGNTTSALASEIECNVIAYKGTTQVASTIGTITGQPTGMTTSLLNNGTVNSAFKVTVTTSMVTRNGILNVPITVDGKTFTKKFTYALTLDGKKGDQGDTAQWYYGESLIHTSGTAILPISQTEDVVVGAMYLNTKTGICYKCTTISGTNATWTYAGNITDGIDIGGRNLVWNSNFHSPVEGTWNNWGSPTTREIVTIDGENWMHIVTTTNSFQGYQQNASKRNGNGEIQAGDKIVFSYDAYAAVDGQNGCIGIHWANANGNIVSQSWASFELTTVKKRYVTKVFTVPNNVVRFNIMIGQFSTISPQELWITNIKGEKGNKATDWTPAPEDIEKEVSNLRTDLQSQIDEKIQTYYQATAPSWSSATDRAKHNGDLWYCTESDPYTGYEEKNVYRYDSTSNTWVEYSATSELFDAVDGKSTIFYGTTSDTFENVDIGDYLVDSVDGSSYRWNGTQWVKVTDYQTAIDNIEIGGRNLLKNSNVKNTSSTNSVVGGTATRTIPSGTVVTLSVQVDADDVIWKSSGNRRIGVASSITKDGGGTQYIEAWAAMTGYTSTGVDKTFDTSFHGRVKSTYTLQGELSLDKVFTLYIQNITSGTVSVSKPKLEIGNKATDWTPAPEDIQDGIDHAQNIANVALSQSVEYIIGTQTAVTGSWTGISNTISELKDGTQIRYWLPYAGSGNATLNLTLANGTTTGAIPIYRQGGSVSNGNVVANRVTTHFPTGSVVSMTYGVDRSISVVSSGTTYTGLFTGWFADGAYDSGNTINRVRLQNVITAETAITAGHIICGTANGYKNIGVNVSFDLSYPLLYASSAIAASKTGDNNFLSINAVSATNNGTVQSGAAKKTLYLKGEVTGNTFKISASPFMTTAQPTTDDGYYYIPLGIMYSTTAIYFQSSNRLYAYIDGAFQPVDTAAVLRAEEAKKVATNYLSADSTGIMIADMNDGEQTPSGATGNNVFINNTSVNIRDGQTTLASFGVDGMQIGLSDESHTTQDYHSWQMIDKEGNSYVHISDLRDTTGWAIFEESYVPIVNFDMGSEPCEYAIELAFPINYNSDIISAEINGVAVNSWEMLGSVKPSEYIKLTPLPSSNDNVTIKYKSSNSALKAYTFGTRQDGSVLGGFSFAEGYNAVARGRYSHSEGYQCKAIGYNSHAEGSNTTAKGRSSHAENSGDAYGDYSHAEGNAITYGYHSHAEGASHASGEYSHSEGYQTGADGNYSHAQNFGTQAKSEAQTAIGKFNIEDTSNAYALIIGNGVDGSNRSNALTVKWDGTITAGNGFSTANTALTISRVISSTYMDAAALNRIRAYKKNGMLYLCFNAEFTSAYSVNTYTTIATISNWNAVFDAYTTIPRQNDGSKIVTLLVTSDGKIKVYSTTPISGWHRASICVPCNS